MDELAPRRATNLDDACCFAANGDVKHCLVPRAETGESRKAKLEDLLGGATRYEEAFAHDFRWLSAHNHDHTCAASCIKKMKKSTMGEKQKVSKSNRASVPILDSSRGHVRSLRWRKTSREEDTTPRQTDCERAHVLQHQRTY